MPFRKRKTPVIVFDAEYVSETDINTGTSSYSHDFNRNQTILNIKSGNVSQQFPEYIQSCQQFQESMTLLRADHYCIWRLLIYLKESLCALLIRKQSHYQYQYR